MAAGGGVDRRVIAVAVVIPLVALVGVVLGAVGGGDDGDAVDPVDTTAPDDPPATTLPADVSVDEGWNAALEEAIQPLEEAIPQLSEAVTSWRSSGRDDAALSRALDDLDTVFTSVRTSLTDLDEHPDDALAASLVRETGRLYVLAVDAHRLAVAADGDVADQYDRLGRRLRVLGDRVFDRARERTAVPFDPGDDVELRLPAEVPDWTRLGLAVGPPLEPEDTNVDELPLERDEQRASQSLADWRAAVAELDVPSPRAVAEALAADDPETLGELARALVAAAEELRTQPVPDGDRSRADRLGLGWLLRADAARAGQLAALGEDLPDDAASLPESLLEVATTGVFLTA